MGGGDLKLKSSPSDRGAGRPMPELPSDTIERASRKGTRRDRRRDCRRVNVTRIRSGRRGDPLLKPPRTTKIERRQDIRSIFARIPGTWLLPALVAFCLKRRVRSRGKSRPREDKVMKTLWMRSGRCITDDDSYIVTTPARSFVQAGRDCEECRIHLKSPKLTFLPGQRWAVAMEELASAIPQLCDALEGI